MRLEYSTVQHSTAHSLRLQSGSCFQPSLCGMLNHLSQASSWCPVCVCLSNACVSAHTGIFWVLEGLNLVCQTAWYELWQVSGWQRTATGTLWVSQVVTTFHAAFSRRSSTGTNKILAQSLCLTLWPSLESLLICHCSGFALDPQQCYKLTGMVEVTLLDWQLGDPGLIFFETQVGSPCGFGWKHLLNTSQLNLTFSLNLHRADCDVFYYCSPIMLY